MKTPRPRLPRRFFDKDPLCAAGFIGATLVAFSGAWALDACLWLRTGLPWPAKLLLSLPLFGLAGQAMHLMGFIGHEGHHFNLARNRHASLALGIVFSSMSVLYITMGMALDHWTHHRHCNTERDPDLQLWGRHRSVLARLFAARNGANRLYAKRALGLLLGRPLDPSIAEIDFPFPRPVLRAYAAFNFACALFWTALYLRIALVDWRLALVGVVIPVVFASAISGVRPYVEHAGLGTDAWHNSRSRTSLFWTVLDLGGNFHLEHHLYPSVPQWLLPSLHRYLAAQGAFDDTTPSDASILGPYRHALGSARHPDEVEALLTEPRREDRSGARRRTTPLFTLDAWEALERRPH